MRNENVTNTDPYGGVGELADEGEQMTACYYCGKHGGTKDHVIPKSKGGTRTVECCGKCNHTKADLSVEEFRAVMAVRAGVLDASDLHKFEFEINPRLQKCIHQKLLTERCWKCYHQWVPGYNEIRAMLKQSPTSVRTKE